ncbi:(2Fe-2S)-binding protein [bacterium]|nr:(2Fe-2S)-binding protein [bacterium]
MDKLNITFVNQDTKAESTLTAEKGELLTQVAHRAGIVIQQTCGGSPSCTDCKIKVISDNFLEAFEAPLGPELRLMGNIFHITRERLSCQAKVISSCKIEYPDAKTIKDKASARSKKWLDDKRKQLDERKNQQQEKRPPERKNLSPQKKSQRRKSKKR